MSERDLRLWLYASPFVGLALYLATIHPHEGGWIRTYNLDGIIIIFLYLVPACLPIRRFQILPLGFLFFIASAYVWHPIFIAASENLSAIDSLRVSFQLEKVVSIFGYAIVELTTSFFFVVLKILFQDWLYSKKHPQEQEEPNSAPNSSNSTP